MALLMKSVNQALEEQGLLALGHDDRLKKSA